MVSPTRSAFTGPGNPKGLSMTDVYSADAAGVAARRPDDRFPDRFSIDADLIALRQGRYAIAAAVGALANGLARRSRKGTAGK
jgi:hypothetical protein